MQETAPWKPCPVQIVQMCRSGKLNEAWGIFFFFPGDCSLFRVWLLSFVWGWYLMVSAWKALEKPFGNATSSAKKSEDEWTVGTHCPGCVCRWGRGSTMGFYLQGLEFSTCMGISIEIKLQYCFSKEASFYDNFKKMYHSNIFSFTKFLCKRSKIL